MIVPSEQDIAADVEPLYNINISLFSVLSPLRPLASSVDAGCIHCLHADLILHPPFLWQPHCELMHIVSLGGGIAPESGGNWRLSIFHDVALAIMTQKDMPRPPLLYGHLMWGRKPRTCGEKYHEHTAIVNGQRGCISCIHRYLPSTEWQYHLYNHLLFQHHV